MNQTIKTLQWNIGGGLIRANQDPAEIGPYDHDGLTHLLTIIKKFNPDLITLQETHTHDREGYSQAKLLAEALNLPYWINDVYDQSHLDPKQGLGQAIISRWPITNHTFTLFFNPQAKTVRPNGEIWTSHNKGITLATITHPIKPLQIGTLHLIPFRKFNLDPLGELCQNLRQDIIKKIKPNQLPFLLQGDFNYNQSTLKDFLPQLNQNTLAEIILTQPTTPKNRWYDHLIYQDLHHLNSTVITEVLTDHYPIFSEFEIIGT